MYQVFLNTCAPRITRIGLSSAGPKAMDSQASPRMLCSTRPLQSPLCLQQGTPHSRCSITWNHAAHLSKWGPDLILQHKQWQKSTIPAWWCGLQVLSIIPCQLETCRASQLAYTAYTCQTLGQYTYGNNTRFVATPWTFWGPGWDSWVYSSIIVHHTPPPPFNIFQNDKKYIKKKKHTSWASIRQWNIGKTKEKNKTSISIAYPLHIHCISIAYPLHIHPYPRHIHPYISNLTTPPRSPSAFGLLRHLWRFLRPASVPPPSPLHSSESPAPHASG